MKPRWREVLASVILVALVFTTSLAIPAVAHETDREQKNVSIRNSEQMTLIWHGSAKPMAAVLTDIVNWLATNFDLPAIYDHPKVQLTSSEDLIGMRYNVYFRDERRPNGPIEIEAIYSDVMKIIFLNDGWRGETPAKQSVLVHEMVHHLQNLGHLKYECPDAREKIAYEAQDRWLKLFNRDLETEFQIDMFTLFVKSACIY